MITSTKGTEQNKMKYQIEINEENVIRVSSMEKAKQEIEQFCQHGVEQSVAQMRKDFAQFGYARVNLNGSDSHYFYVEPV